MMASDVEHHSFHTNNIGNGVHETSQAEKEDTLVAIYTRVSSPWQVTHGYSLEEQIRLCRERCDMMRWKVQYLFKENGESAATTDRPKFQLMMEKARESAFDVLVFWKLDRFCRSLKDVVNIEAELKQYGIALYSVTEQIDTTTAVGRFNFRNLASASEMERDLIKERVKMGMVAMATKHKWPNRKPPLGYTLTEERKLRIDEEEAKLVRRIFEMYLKLRSMARVAFELNKDGIRTKSGRWSARTVKKVLDNEIYIGKFEVAGVSDSLEECRIVDNKTFENARSLRKDAMREHRPVPNDMKEAAIEAVFNEYLQLLRSDEDEDLNRIV